jgi:dipeptidyl aminopeptidase/acylaminoacyl peptidase
MLSTLSLGFVLPLLSILADFPQQVDPIRTVAEQSGYRATSRHGDVVAVCGELAKRFPNAELSTLGSSAEGRSLPVLILADPPIKTPAEAARSGKLVALAIGNIHGGEVCGKEALLMLARELLERDHHPLLKDVIVIVAPIYNADGNERMSKENRPGQNGPEQGMGRRGNSRDLDLNRDFVKLEAPETRALVRFFNTWKPHLFIDTHTTNGSYHRYTITYEGAKNPAGDDRIVKFTRDNFFPEITQSFEGRTEWQAYYYGNFNRGHTRWTTYPADACYGTTYFGLRNRLSVLSEAYAYAPFKDRVLATREFVRTCLERAAGRKKEILSLISDTEKASIKAGQAPRGDDRIAIRFEPGPLPHAEPILGFVEKPQDGNHVKTDEQKDYPAEVWNAFRGTESVVRPFAYLFPPRFTEAKDTLQRHGIDVQELREDIELDLEAYKISEIGSRDSGGWNQQGLVDLKVEPRQEVQRISAGTLIVKTAQPLGNLIVYLLEPRSSDGLAAWKFFSDGLAPGADFPVLRLPQPVPLLTVDVDALPEERKPKRPITFEMARGGRGGSRLSGGFSPPEWLDVEHWLQVRDGKLYKVEVKSGRSSPFLRDTEPLVKALRRLPDLEESAESIARRSFFNMDPDRKGFLFDRHDDLYYATFDGSVAVRLTNQPGSERHPQFSPDGRSVAFIRGFDLYVVDIATTKERALTSGGTEAVRHGIADWVYFEEIFNRHWPAFWWSPDSKRIALMGFDDTPVGTLTMLDDTETPRKVEQNRYPRAGEANPKVRIGIVDAAGGDVRWADLSSYSPEALLVSSVGWWPDSTSAYCYLQDRGQTWLDLVKLSAEAAVPKPERLFRETSSAWIADLEPLKVLKDGSFLWASERDGWKHLYHYSADGTLKRRLTSGDWEVRSVVSVDENAGWIYFTGTRNEPMSTNLYRVGLGGVMERITQGTGSHQVSMGPEGRYYVDIWSDIHTPPRASLYSSTGTLVRNLDSNPSYAINEYCFGPRTRLQIPARDGFLMEAELILPPDLDPRRKYPAWFVTYGGPHTPTVADGWMGGRLWEQAMASEGFVVFRVDPRSASGKGAISARRAFHQLGVQELEDIKDAIGWLKKKPFVDGTRIGMSGHSYGGFMTSYAMTHCDLFAAGIAGAPVTDWRDYDTIYTERFMGLPQDNPKGYDASSVVKAARNLHGKLLIAHGLIDDNVSVRNSMRLVEALQAANKDFELMIYPGSRHGIFSNHYNQLQIDFIRRTLGNARQGAPVSLTPVADRPVSRRARGG